MKLTKIIAALSSAVMSVSMLSVFSADADETGEKLYTFQEILDMSDEEFFAAFPDAESKLEETKNFYEDIYKNQLIQEAESQYEFYKNCTVVGGVNPTDGVTLEEFTENYLADEYKIHYSGRYNVLDQLYNDYEVKYVPNITEKNMKYVFGDYISLMNSPIENFVCYETNEDAVYFDYLFSVKFENLDSEKNEINDKNLLIKVKFDESAGQVVPYLLYSSAPLTSSEKKEVFTGDVNLDDTVDLYDAVWIASHLVHVFELSEGQQKVADVNSDGMCNLYDAVEIAKTLM